MCYEKKAYLYLLFPYTGKKKIFKRAHQNPNANVRARPDFTIWAVGYRPPPRVPASFSHILCKIWEHTYVQKD